MLVYAVLYVLLLVMFRLVGVIVVRCVVWFGLFAVLWLCCYCLLCRCVSCHSLLLGAPEPHLTYERQLLHDRACFRYVFIIKVVCWRAHMLCMYAYVYIYIYIYTHIHICIGVIGFMCVIRMCCVYYVTGLLVVCWSTMQNSAIIIIIHYYHYYYHYYYYYYYHCLSLLEGTMRNMRRKLGENCL